MRLYDQEVGLNIKMLLYEQQVGLDRRMLLWEQVVGINIKWLYEYDQEVGLDIKVLLWLLTGSIFRYKYYSMNIIVKQAYI